MGLRIIRWASLTATPWRNGGGTAVDIIGHPEPSTDDGFDWHINIATIDRSGPFSHFPDIDRDFRVLDGGGVELTVEGDVPRSLMANGPEYRFPGDRQTYARLLVERTRCRAFNVLTRRNVFLSDVTAVEIEGDEALQPVSEAIVGVIRRGTLDVELDANRYRLGPLDTFVATEEVSAHSDDGAELFLVNLVRL